MIRLLMRVREAPTQPEIKARAHAATETSMALHLLAARRRKQEPEAAPKRESKRRCQIIWKLKSAVISHAV
jgi:hypothetical protein